MSNEEKKKRAEYNAHRKKMIMVQAIIIIALTVITIFTSAMYYRNNKVSYINYSESSDVDYKVYLKENDFYEEEYLEKDQIYVASLIDNVVADFKYDLVVSQENVDFEYSYKIASQLKIVDSKTKVEIYAPTEVLKEKATYSVFDASKINIKEQITINYDQYNQEAKRFINFTDLKDVTSTLVLNLFVEVNSICEQDMVGTKEEYVVSLNIPLVEQKVDIKMSSSIPVKEGTIACDNSKSICVYKIISYITFPLDILCIIILLAYIYLTRNQDINYQIRVKKIVNNYKSYIQKINNKFVYKGYQVLMVDTFKEMLDIRETIDAPILMNENEDQTCTRFIIPTNTKLLYMFEVKVEGFCYDPDEELFGVVEELNDEVEEVQEPIKTDDVQEIKVEEEKKEVKVIKEPRPAKVINPSVDVLAEYIKNNFNDAVIVYGKTNNNYRVYRNKKLFLIVQSTNSDYRMTFQRKPISMSQFLLKYTKFISKANSPQGEQWFKVINKGDITEEDLKTMIRFSYKYLIDEENKAIAKKQKEKEKAMAKKAALKAKEKAKKDALKAKEKAKKDALKAKEKEALKAEKSNIA